MVRGRILAGIGLGALVARALGCSLFVNLDGYVGESDAAQAASGDAQADGPGEGAVEAASGEAGTKRDAADAADGPIADAQQVDGSIADAAADGVADSGAVCDIGGMSYSAGTTNPGNACQLCHPGTSTTAWSNVADGTACGSAGACVAGTCGTCTTTSYEGPQAVASVALGSTAEWQCPGGSGTPCSGVQLYDYVHAIDGQTASADLSTGSKATSESIDATGFFTSAIVPAGSFIKGIEVQVYRYESGSCSVADSVVQLVKAGATFGSQNKATTACWPQTPPQAATYGCPTCAWGVAGGLSYADVTDSTFGVRLVAKDNAGLATTAYVDALVMAVTSCH
jgi:hypothetical protein